MCQLAENVISQGPNEVPKDEPKSVWPKWDGIFALRVGDIVTIPGSAVRRKVKKENDDSFKSCLRKKRISDATFLYGNDKGTYTAMVTPGPNNECLLEAIAFSGQNEGLDTTNALYEFVRHTLGAGDDTEAIVEDNIGLGFDQALFVLMGDDGSLQDRRMRDQGLLDLER